MNLPFEPLDVAPRLLAWYGECGRDLPWRQTRDPYRIWLSEIMLQQTTVATATPYYRKFLEVFPDIATLASAPLEQVIEVWAGLGYYSRARNLHRTARVIVGDYDGLFPETVEGLSALPGIGRSTAGAIVSIAFDRPAPILDGNVRRVLVRLFALSGDPRSRDADRQLWGWAAALGSSERPHDYAQAIMDLGATVCTPRDPACTVCPLVEFCQARLEGLERQLPAGRVRKSVPVRHQVAMMVEVAGRCMARPRPAEGFLGGLWELPVADRLDEETPLATAARLAGELGLSGRQSVIGKVRHAYSHFTLELALVRLVAARPGRCAETDWQWLTPAELADKPLHGAHRKALEILAPVGALEGADE